MKPIPFTKMHGAANDFVVIDHRDPFLPEEAGRAAALFRALCDRRRGIGADGVLLLERDPELDFAMRYHNADGGEADFCGNGARCLARFALERGLGRGGRVRFRSRAGVQEGRLAPGELVALHFGRVGPAGPPEILEAAGRRFEGCAVTVGVPHFVVEQPAGEPLDVPGWGAALRAHPRFGREGTNVDFVRRPAGGDAAAGASAGPGTEWVLMRTFERGVEAETLACGSGAIATALWAAARGAASPVGVVTAGGDVLVVSFEPADGGWDVTLTGPAEVAFTGTWARPPQ